MFYRPTSLWPWTLLVATVIEIGIVVPAETYVSNVDLRLTAIKS